MFKPQFLKKGDKIAIISPAGKVEKNIIENAVKTFSNWGLNVVVGKNAYNKYNQFAGTDRERAEDLQQMIDDESIKAIISSRGGYGSIRVIEDINFKNLKKTNKWVIGFSDITVFHSYLNNHIYIETIHGAMPKNFPLFPEENPSVISLKAALFGENIDIEIDGHDNNISGNAEGILTGGNLSILYSLIGTKYDYDYTDKILFIEDLNEYLYHADRMLLSLKLSGKFDRLRGMIVGDFTDMKDNETAFGKNIFEIIHEHTSYFGFPVCFGFPSGHDKKNIALRFGSKVELSVRNNSLLKYL